MPILLNYSNDASLLSIIEYQTRKLLLIDKNSHWVFYGMTCYFKQEAAIRLAKKLKAILHDRLLEFHILIDKDEYFKDITNANSFILELSSIIQIPNDSISITPISTKNNKLFHAKAYGLIKYNYQNLEKSQSFAIVTSGNLTNAGLEKNLEICQIFYDTFSIQQFLNIFVNLKNNYTLSEQELSVQKELQQAFKILSSGTFYHQWDQKHKTDLRFRLKYSEEAKNRRKNEIDKKEQYLGYDSDQEAQSFSKAPIDIEEFFEKFPKVIPDRLLGRYSIDTILGRWVPIEISNLIEKELNDLTDIYIHVFQNEIYNKLNKYLKDLKFDIHILIQENIIDLSDEDNSNAISKWEKRVRQISQDKNLVKLLLWDYEKIPLSLDSFQERDLLLTFYARLKQFYNPNINRQGVGQILSINNHEQINNDFFKDLSQEVQRKLKNNRLGDLYNKVVRDDKFCAILQKDKHIIEGIFVKLEYPKDFNSGEVEANKLVYKDKYGEEKLLLIEDLITFKVLKNKE